MTYFIFILLLLRCGFTIFVPEEHENWSLLPHGKCGSAYSTRIIGGEDAPMHAYPWLGRLAYGFGGKLVNFICSGSLVNHDTVLTAAHCIKYSGTLISYVRFGEYRTTTDPDCVGKECSDAVVDVPVVKVICHKYFNDTTYENDVAVLKLLKKVKFTVFIQPICIGGTDFIRDNFEGRLAEVAGWGIENIKTRAVSKVLKFIKIPVLNQSHCEDKFKTINWTVIPQKQLCAGGQVGIDSCSGDSGGPLMILHTDPHGMRFYALGIVSYGNIQCGDSDLPGIYTNVSTFLKWFLDHL